MKNNYDVGEFLCDISRLSLSCPARVKRSESAPFTFFLNSDASTEYGTGVRA